MGGWSRAWIVYAFEEKSDTRGTTFYIAWVWLSFRVNRMDEANGGYYSFTMVMTLTLIGRHSGNKIKKLHLCDLNSRFFLYIQSHDEKPAHYTAPRHLPLNTRMRAIHRPRSNYCQSAIKTLPLLTYIYIPVYINPSTKSHTYIHTCTHARNNLPLAKWSPLSAELL